MSEFFKDLSLIVGLINVRFQVFMAMSMKVTALWDIVTRRLVAVDRHFRGAYCLITLMLVDYIINAPK